MNYSAKECDTTTCPSVVHDGWIANQYTASKVFLGHNRRERRIRPFAVLKLLENTQVYS